MSLKNRLQRLEKATREDEIVISQKDGTEARFPRSAGLEALSNLFERLGAGEDAPPEHPLIAAARKSDDPKWSGSFYAVNDPEEWTTAVEDLSE